MAQSGKNHGEKSSHISKISAMWDEFILIWKIVLGSKMHHSRFTNSPFTILKFTIIQVRYHTQKACLTLYKEQLRKSNFKFVSYQGGCLLGA